MDELPRPARSGDFAFTPSTLARLRRLLAESAAPAAIARALGCGPGTLHSICAKHGLRLSARPEPDRHAAPSSPPLGFRRRSSWPDWRR
jgi:hypothetical protein